MPLHPDAQAFLDRIKDQPEPFEMTIDEFRARVATIIAPAEPLDIGIVDNVLVPGGDGQDMAVRVYIPRNDGPMPIIVWLHGGSFTRGTLDLFDPGRRVLAKLAQCIVVAVDQRLSPEAQFPQPVEDGLAALRWVRLQAKRLGGDPLLVGVGGESSGGNLAAAVEIRARQDGDPVAFTVLVEPLLDATLSGPSIDQFADGYGLTKSQLAWAYQQYAPDADYKDALVSPLFRDDIAQAAPTVVISIENDPARDDGERYAERLKQAGVHVLHRRVDGYVHHFPGPDTVSLTSSLLRDLLAGPA